MFGSLTETFQNVFSSFGGKKKITEDNIADAMRKVRLALLDADVNYAVASRFIKQVKEKALGEAVLKSVDPGDQFTKIVHSELVSLMGESEPELNLKGLPAIIMLCGLQGAGKTTQCAKLANYFKNQNKRPFLIACDLQRPAAVDQLKTLARQIDVPVFSIEGERNPLKVAKEGLEQAKKEGAEIVLVDTAGRLHIDEVLMKELEGLKNELNPHEILFVANATTGQDAVKTAAHFDETVSITGTILTMLDGGARAGAAISITEVTKKPLKFEGVGEKLADLQLFNPESMADRILGMGDVINLVRRAEEHLEEEDSEKMEKKLKNASFTYEDYLSQMAGIKKMGSLKGILKMMPGMSEMGDLDVSEGEFSKLEAMILSMTTAERKGKVDLEPSRRRRIAKGSGTTIDDVNRLVKGFKRLKKMCKNLPGLKKKFQKESGKKDRDLFKMLKF